MMQITFLGTGTSHGIPVIGCTCEVCRSTDRRNKRNRTGIWVRDETGSAVIDVSCEFRLAALEYGLSELDFALLTHAHSDHISGLDDLRVFSQRSGKGVPIYGDRITLTEVKQKYAYAFEETRDYGGGVPRFSLMETHAGATWHAGPWEIRSLRVMHGPEPILAYRINDFAFLTDLTEIPQETLEQLKGLKVLALDCLRDRPHSTHLSVDQAVEYAERIGAERTFFVHMCHELDHEATEKRLPQNVRLAYDGLCVTL